MCLHHNLGCRGYEERVGSSENEDVDHQHFVHGPGTVDAHSDIFLGSGKPSGQRHRGFRRPGLEIRFSSGLKPLRAIWSHEIDPRNAR